MWDAVLIFAAVRVAASALTMAWSCSSGIAWFGVGYVKVLEWRVVTPPTVSVHATKSFQSWSEWCWRLQSVMWTSASPTFSFVLCQRSKSFRRWAQ